MTWQSFLRKTQPAQQQIRVQRLFNIETMEKKVNDEVGCCFLRSIVVIVRFFDFFFAPYTACYICTASFRVLEVAQKRLVPDGHSGVFFLLCGSDRQLEYGARE